MANIKKTHGGSRHGGKAFNATSPEAEASEFLRFHASQVYKVSRPDRIHNEALYQKAGKSQVAKATNAAEEMSKWFLF